MKNKRTTKRTPRNGHRSEAVGYQEYPDQWEVGKMLEAERRKPTLYDDIKQVETHIAIQTKEIEHRQYALETAQDSLADLKAKRITLVEQLRQEMRLARTH